MTTEAEKTQIQVVETEVRAKQSQTRQLLATLGQIDNDFQVKVLKFRVDDNVQNKLKKTLKVFETNVSEKSKSIEGQEKLSPAVKKNSNLTISEKSR